MNPTLDRRTAEAIAQAFEAWADAWDEDTEENKNRLTRMAQEHYSPGGPSMPAIAARLEAQRLRRLHDGENE